VLFSLVEFSYNVWRIKVSGQENNTRSACFEMLLNQYSLEQLIYTGHYDGNTTESISRMGWVKEGLIADLSTLTNDAVEQNQLL